MEYPHTLTHYSIAYSKDGGARVRSPYLQVAGVPCFYQPAPSSNRQPTVQADTEQELGKVYLEDGTTWEDVEVGHLLKVYPYGQDKYLKVMGKKDLCSLGRVFRIDVTEDISGEFDG